MPAKPWSTGSVASVASHYTSHRLSGDVKKQLVDLLSKKLDEIIIELEEETLSKDPGRKTLDDPERDRLGFSRTRGLILDRLTNFESVGSAAVVRANEDLEEYLRTLVLNAGEMADKERMNTIKPRHIELTLNNLNLRQTDDLEMSEHEPEEGISVEGDGYYDIQRVKSIARRHAKMSITDDAADDLLLTYGDMVSELESDIRKHANLGRDPMYFIDSVNRLSALMAFGWIRRMLMKAADNARERGYSRIDIEQIVHIDPFE